MKVYCISGLGANCSVYDNLKLPEGYHKVYLEWIQPKPKESIESYAHRMADEIDTEEDFMLMGLSFGGVIAQEIAAIKKPKKLILISTIKSEKEAPLLFRFSKWTKAHRLIPIWFITSDRIVSYAFFRKLYSRNLPELNNIFTYRDPQYLRWSFDKIIQWKAKRKTYSETIHIHGDKDPLFPIKRIKNPISIDQGNHLMIVMKHKKINQILQEKL